MIGVISYDAGGAEIISSYIVQNNLACLYSVAGPALKIFERKLGRLDVLALDAVIEQSEWVLCGTGWQTDFELQAMEMAKAAGKRSVAFLDHWVNYLERFVRDGEIQLPDEIWVGDALAEEIAHRTFPEIVVRMMGNPYFDNLKRELSSIPCKYTNVNKSISVLYVCEPVREYALLEYGNERYWGYTEEDALHYFLSNIDALGVFVNCIVIRPHPSEQPEKYEWAKFEYDLPIMAGGVKTLVEEVAACDMVVGCESMAMVVGLLAGKRVVSCIPPGGKACALPQVEIAHLQHILENR